LKRFLKFLDEHAEEIALVILMACMSVIIGVQVFMRYVMKSSLSWSEEIARYMFIWLIYIGISYGVKTDRHINVDAVRRILPKKINAIVSAISDLIFLLFSIIVVAAGMKVATKIFMSGQRTPALQIPMGLIYMAVPVGFTLVTIRLLQKIIYSSYKKKGA